MKKLIQIGFMLIALSSHGQQTVGFLENARKYAVEEDYEASLRVIREGLRNYPSDHDLRVFEINLYLWKGEHAIAEIFIQNLLTDYPKDHEALILYVKKSWWAEEWDSLLERSELALQSHPDDPFFVEKKLLALINLEDYKKASEYYKSMSEKSEEVEKLWMQIRLRYHQQIGATVSYATFDQNFSPWSLVRLEYLHVSRHGWNVSSTYGQMFEERGATFNAEFYPTITKNLHGYFEAGYSNTRIFPEYRLGGELIANIGNVEISSGAKLLNFKEQSEQIHIYTSGLNLYVGNFYVSYKGFLLADVSADHPVTHSVVSRKYFRNRFHFVQLNLTKGSTPLQINSYREVSRIKASSISMMYSHLVADQFIVKGAIGGQKENYSEGNNRNRMTISLGVSKIF